MERRPQRSNDPDDRCLFDYLVDIEVVRRTLLGQS
jgi:hypothetical protein